jgi:hypothetical protein
MQKQKIENLGNDKRQNQESGRKEGREGGREQSLVLFLVGHSAKPSKRPPYLQGPGEDATPTHRPSLLLLLSLSSEVSATIASLSLPLNPVLGLGNFLFLVARPILASWFRVLRLMDCQSPVVGLLAVILGLNLEIVLWAKY